MTGGGIGDSIGLREDTHTHTHTHTLLGLFGVSKRSPGHDDVLDMNLLTFSRFPKDISKDFSGLQKWFQQIQIQNTHTQYLYTVPHA